GPGIAGDHAMQCQSGLPPDQWTVERPARQAVADDDGSDHPWAPSRCELAVRGWGPAVIDRRGRPRAGGGSPFIGTPRRGVLRPLPAPEPGERRTAGVQDDLTRMP